ncbi:MAG: AMP-dependent synthetase/ligase [Terriglobales bacterium]
MAAQKLLKTAERPSLASLNDLMLRIAQRGEAPLLYSRAVAAPGQPAAWRALSAAAFSQQVRAIASRLRQLGLAEGDRVGLLSENRPEWLLADFAGLAIGVADVPIYPTLTGPQAAYILDNSGARGVFVSSPAQLEKILAEAARLSALEWIACFEPAPLPPMAPASRPRVLAWADFLATPPLAAAEFDAALAATSPLRAATLIYTSGTTGQPKGVLLTHANLCANLNVAAEGFDYRPGDCRLSFLPLSHITERHLAYNDLIHEVRIYFAESFDRVPANLLEVRPHSLVSVPRLYEKIALAVRAQAEGHGWLRRRIFAWGLRVGRSVAAERMAGWPACPGAPRPPWPRRCRAWLADRLIYRKIRARLGGRVRTCIAGGAPLGRELGEFLLSLGLVIFDGYGLSETSPVIAVNKPGACRIGSVGRPLPNVAIRFAADGELLVRGPSVFAGYFRLPEETAAAFSDGWFHTGDIGYQDGDGFLFITDRKKDLIKTSGGKFIAPQPIEAKLKASPYVAEAVLVGDKRNFVSALILPNAEALQGRDRDAVEALIAAEIERVNCDLARFETIKKFRLLPRELSLAAGEITPSLKVRRRAVEERYHDLIASMYEPVAPAPANP